MYINFEHSDPNNPCSCSTKWNYGGRDKLLMQFACNNVQIYKSTIIWNTTFSRRNLLCNVRYIVISLFLVYIIVDFHLMISVILTMLPSFSNFKNSFKSTLIKNIPFGRIKQDIQLQNNNDGIQEHTIMVHFKNPN